MIFDIIMDINLRRIVYFSKGVKYGTRKISENENHYQ